jgi:type 1 glutamine amidotransferase
MVFGETWINHHGDHGSESTRGLLNGTLSSHPITNGVSDVWGPTDVYGIRDLPADAQVVLFGQTLSGMTPDSPPNYEKSLMPIAWMRHYTTDSGKKARVFFSTTGAAVDLESEDLRRLLVNAVFWGLEMEDQIPDRANVDYVSAYKPSYFGFGKHKPGMRPADYQLDK